MNAPAIAPAAQMLTRPRLASRRAISFASVVTMRPPVAAHGWPTAIELPYVDLVPVDGARRLSFPPLLPRGSVRENLRAESFVDLDEIHILELVPTS